MVATSAFSGLVSSACALASAAAIAPMVSLDRCMARRHPPFHWMLDPALTVGDRVPGVVLIPASVQRLGDDAQLDNEVIAEVHRFDFATLLLPEPDQRRLVAAHNDPRVR